MSLTPKSGSGRKTEKSGSPPTRKSKEHFTTDGHKRYCTNYPKGKDELIEEWSRVNCDACLIKGKPKSHMSLEMQEKIREFKEKRKISKKDC